MSIAVKKEIIDLVEEIFVIADNDEPDDLPLASFPRIKKLADKVLTLLSQQPLAGEFTKRCRDTYSMKCISDKECGEDFQEAIDRLDRVEAEKADLLAACKEIAKADKEKISLLLWDGLICVISDMIEIAEAAIAKAEQ